MKKHSHFSIPILIMCLIIFFSSQPAVKSAATSGYLTMSGVHIAEQLGWVETGTSSDTALISHLDRDFRQFAHGFAFFILTLATVFAFSKSRLKPTVYLPIIALLTLVFAATDEIHQRFVPGRGMEWQDIVSDAQGIALALSIGTIYIYSKQIINTKK